MESKDKTSFIPKTKISSSGYGSSTDLSSIFFAISFVLFLLVITLYGGMYFYNDYLSKKIEQKKDYLEKSKEAFEPELISELKNLDNRIKVSQEILNFHKTPLPIFKILEENTLETITFKSFEYKNNEDGTYTLSMDGRAERFNSLALQSKIFGDVDFFRNPIFSNLGVDSDGGISFVFETKLKSDEMLLENIINNQYFFEEKNIDVIKEDTQSLGEDKLIE